MLVQDGVGAVRVQVFRVDQEAVHVEEAGADGTRWGGAELGGLVGCVDGSFLRRGEGWVRWGCRTVLRKPLWPFFSSRPAGLEGARCVLLEESEFTSVVA